MRRLWGLVGLCGVCALPGGAWAQEPSEPPPALPPPPFASMPSETQPEKPADWADPIDPTEIWVRAGLHPRLENFAPFILTVPGQAMLLERSKGPGRGGDPSLRVDPVDADEEDDQTINPEDEDLEGGALRAPAAANPYVLKESERGGASWYGIRFHKKRTASGERFDMNAFTAAHKTLPFGTRVCVRSLLTGRAVEVRINDRGPFHAGRVIDLSQAAAEKIGGKGLGIKQVSLTPLGDAGDAVDGEALCADRAPPEASATQAPSPN